MMEDHDSDAIRGQWMEGEPSGRCVPTAGPFAAPEPRNLVPLLVEQAGPDYGLVWVLASRSELVRGAVFPAHGSRWLVTGRSPSGVTFLCREIAAETGR